MHALNRSVFLLGWVAISATAAPILSTNAPQASFDKGMFSLPELTDPKDKYILTIVAGADKPQSLVLPAGANGLMLGAAALPKGSWSWSYLVQRNAKPALELVTATGLHLSNAQVSAYEGGVLLEWRCTAGAGSYKLAVAEDQAGDASKPPEWGDDTSYEVDADVCTDNPRNHGHYVLAPDSGKRYRWKVTAVDADKIEIAQSEARVFDVAPPLTKQLQRAGWHLQQSDTITPEAASQPAMFGYAASADDKTPRSSSYAAQFALIWTGKPVTDGIYPRVAVEARRNSSGDAKASDVSRFRAGVTSSPEHFNWTAAAKYETDRKDMTRKGMVELSVTPLPGYILGTYQNFPAVPPGERDVAGNIPLDRRPFLQVMPLISFGADLGKTFEVGTSKETGDTVKRLRADLRFDMRWPKLAGMVRAQSISTYAEGTVWRLFGVNSSHHLAKAGISIGITPEISLEVAYLVGEDAPTFAFSRSTNVGLGVKF